MVTYRTLGGIVFLFHIQCFAPQASADLRYCFNSKHGGKEIQNDLLSNGAFGTWRRVKREWIIPAINLSENLKGPYPKFVVKIKSSNQDKAAVTYKITGSGADQPPEKLFIIDPQSGIIYVTQPLDREITAAYTLWAHAVNERGGAEEPVRLLVNVVDQNDNAPEFKQGRVYGGVSESARIGDSVVKVTAVDKDDPSTSNGVIRYKITAQLPETSGGDMFDVDPVTGVIGVKAPGLDRETQPEYKLVVQAADSEGEGLTSTCTAVITVLDSNDNAPLFSATFSTASVPENMVGAEVARLKVTDKDELGSPNTNTVFALIRGNEGGEFSISTGANQMEGILTTAKELDFEGRPFYTLLVTATNEAPFAAPVAASTATVSVEVLDDNEPPAFLPAELRAAVAENAELGSWVADLRAQDPDAIRQQSVRYELMNDTAGWLSVDGDSGRVKVKGGVDRESHHVVDGDYKVLVLAYDNDAVPATGTGTLVVGVLDENDNGPAVEQRTARLCHRLPRPALLHVADPDGPGHAAPFAAELLGGHGMNWTVGIDPTANAVTLAPQGDVPPGRYKVLLRLYDAAMLHQDSALDVEVCRCWGAASTCSAPDPAGPRLSVPSVLTPILGALFVLLALLLLFLLMRRRRRRRRRWEEKVALSEELPRGDVFVYNEEGGGEEDGDYDLTLLNDPPVVTCSEMLPTVQGHPGYRPLQANEEIGKFLKENLHAADGDVTAPPYDSVQVFDYEGSGSGASSLSSILSDSDEEQNVQALEAWGPRFGKVDGLYADRIDEGDDTKTLPGKTEWV